MACSEPSARVFLGSFDERLVAVGRSGEGGQPGVIAARTTISAPWQALPPLPELTDALVMRLAAAPDGSQVVAVGNAMDDRPVILVSPPR